MNRFFLFVLLATIGASVHAQQSDPFAPAQPLADGWEKMDERLIFLMVRLVDVEANLEAVDLAIAKNGARAGVARSTASRAEAGSDRMDRRAGGPVRWDQFYGRTAEKFFYHPTQNHTYHTETILSQQSPSNDNQVAPGVPSRQGLPVHQRPPQFDYMYRANENAKERATAEVAKIANKVDALAARRAELELEQSKLWCEVAFRVVSRNDLNRQPLYRFAPKGTGNEDLLAATTFVTTALSIVESGESDQSGTFRQIKPMISKARKDLSDQWLRLGVKYQDESSNEWRFATLARYIEDISSNLSDSYAVSLDSARNSDADRRDMYRGLLQKSLVQYAEAVLALNEMATELANAKSFEPDLQKELQATKVSFFPMNVETSKSSSEAPPSTRTISLFNGVSLDGWHTEAKQWKVRNGILVGEKLDPNESGSFLISDASYKDFTLYAEFRLLEGNSGIQIRSLEKANGMIAGPQADITFQQEFRWLGCLTGERIQPEMIAQSSQEVKDHLRQVVDPNGWNSMRISVKGSQVAIFINDIKTVQASLPRGYESGVVALQLHGGEGRIRIEFRQITIEEDSPN